MIMLSNEKISLDVRSGSFCIYENETHDCLYSGEVDSAMFGGDYEKMVSKAKRTFASLSE